MGEADAGEGRIAFADGVETTARPEGDPAAPALAVAAHVTARGAAIPAKRWRLSPAPGGWRVHRA